MIGTPFIMTQKTLNPILLTLFRMGFFGAAHGWGGGLFGPPSVKSATQILQWWNLAQLYLAREVPKNAWITWHSPWILLASAFFHRKSANFSTSRNPHIDWILIYYFNFLNFSWVFSNCFNNHGYKFDDVSKNNYSRSS